MYCYIYFRDAIELIFVQSDDYGEETEFEASDIIDMGNIKAARFVIDNPKQFDGKVFYCKGNDDYFSANEAGVKVTSDSHDYFVSQWSEWSKCEDMNGNNTVSRHRKRGDGSNVEQTRYCRCSDLSELPSPR